MTAGLERREPGVIHLDELPPVGVMRKLQLELDVHATRVDHRTSATWLPGTPTSRRAA